MKIITFDFDNTIAMSYMDTRGDTPIPVFQEYNYKIIDRIKQNIEEGNDVYLVTSRKESMERYFPEQSIPYHLKQLELDDYFLPNRLFYTNGHSKYPILLKLKTELHYDDDIEEHRDAWDADYVVKQPLDDFEDGSKVGKTVIFDAEDNILILQRSDEGHYWDLPGGHIKDIEASRVPDGLKDGTEREIYEETGLLMSFMKDFFVYDFKHKGKMHNINMFLSKIDNVQPQIRLDIQDHIENIDYKWVKLEDLEPLLSKCTMNLRKAHAELTTMDVIFEQDEPFQRAMKKKHRNMKRRLVGYGKNKHFGGGKGHSRPKMDRSKSAPAGFGVLEEENDEKSKKKVKIKVKFVKNIEEKRKKRKKRAKKRRKTRKKQAKFAYYGGYFPYYDMHDSGGSADSGADGRGGGE